MYVVFLGTGGSGAPPGRAENCILVDTGDARIVLDAGPGCGQRLQEAGYSVCEIDYVYITHLHIDHWAGLFDIAVYSAAEQCRPPRIVAASPVAGEALEALLPRLPRVYREQCSSLIGIEPRRRWSPGARLEVEPVEGRHAVTSYGALVYWDGEPVLYYSGDTAPTETVEDAVKRAAVAAVETTIPSSLAEVAQESGHHTVEQVLAYRGVIRSGSTLVTIHLTRESLKELRERARAGKLPQGVVVPVDGLAMSL
ncbi:MBL fold metallo-hydrolase [Pyrodictium abyssi]|uniref:MBL fold metallo-hydrolase n=1 Tax=Pyrodictium abyssi TaxID=54256 RepID=A0ABN6ZND6_9CREN|nr:MBL fold metallo-hydrolase [Pyrodictium abyssi]